MSINFLRVFAATCISADVKASEVPIVGCVSLEARGKARKQSGCHKVCRRRQDVGVDG